MRVLITGANGYLGQGVSTRLLDRGHRVIATDFAADNIDKRAEIKVCDIFQIDNPYEFFGRPDVVLHMAWRYGFVHYSDSHITDLPKHYLFLKKMFESGVKQVAVLGSMHEIGFFEGSINDDTPCNPITPYGISKNALRNLVAMLSKKNGIPYQWFRGYYIVGNSEFGSSIFSKITAAEKEGRAEFPFTMGQNQYDFIDYEEFCTDIAAAVTQSEIVGIINICSGKPEKLADRVERFIKDNHYSIKLKYGAFPDRPYDSKAVWGNNEKILRIINHSK